MNRLLAAGLVGLGTLATQTQADDGPRLLEFDAPGSTSVVSPICGGLCGTVAYANNDAGTVTGFYTDESVVPHGFLRTRDGQFTSFDAPGAGLGSMLDQGTVPYSINDAGVIAGQYEDPGNVFHGFIRHHDGSFVSFDAPGAGTAAGSGTLAYSLNLKGDTAGVSFDDNFGEHGFVRWHGGETVSFDPDGSIGTMVCQETCLNASGSAAGYYLDAAFTIHGFVRHRNGTLVSFDAPAAGAGGVFGT
jgi:hypothetical protein